MSSARVRGVESYGMLCSAYDMGWSCTADGAAVELPGSAVAGAACPEQPPPEVLLPLRNAGWLHPCDLASASLKTGIISMDNFNVRPSVPVAHWCW